MTRSQRSRRLRGVSQRGAALKHWDMHFGPNMTPMVDVVMVILIFFMAGTALIAPEMFLTAGLAVDPSDIDLPGPIVEDPFELPPVRFTLRLSRVSGGVSGRVPGGASGRTVIDGLGMRSGTLDELATRLSDLAGDQSEMAILIKPSPDVPFADVVAVHDRVEAAGIHRVGLLESGGSD